MRLRGIFASSVLVLSGCTTLGTMAPISKEGVTATEVVQAIQCELASVYSDPDPSINILSKWTARTKLELDVTDTVETTPGIVITPTIVDATVTFPGGGDFSNQNTRKATEQFDVTIGDLRPTTTIGASLLSSCAPPGDPHAATGLGLGSWLREVAHSIKQPNSAASLADIDYEVEFNVGRSVSGGLTFKTSLVALSLDKQSDKDVFDNHLTITFSDKSAAVATTHGVTSTPVTRDQDLTQKQQFLTPLRILPPAAGF